MAETNTCAADKCAAIEQAIDVYDVSVFLAALKQIIVRLAGKDADVNPPPQDDDAEERSDRP